MVLNLEPCIHAFRGGVIQSINCITPKEPLASNSWVFPKNTYPWRPAQPRVQSWHGCWHYSQFPGWPILNWTYLPSGGKFPDPTLEYNRYSICKPLLNYLPEWRGEEKTIQVSVQLSTEVCVRFQLCIYENGKLAPASKLVPDRAALTMEKRKHSNRQDSL